MPKTFPSQSENFWPSFCVWFLIVLAESVNQQLRRYICCIVIFELETSEH